MISVWCCFFWCNDRLRPTVPAARSARFHPDPTPSMHLTEPSSRFLPLKHLLRLAVIPCCLAAAPASAESSGAPQREEAIRIIRSVNDHWQKTHPKHGDAFWNRAVYHIGNLHAYAVTREPAYRAFSEAWAEQNDWQGAKSKRRSEWRYDYGENDRYVLFGDWQVCFQVYFALNRLDKQSAKIARAKEVMSYQITTSQNDYLWWSDGLFMVMPVMTEMHRLTGDATYLRKLREYFDYATDLMYDAPAGLFFRDAKYVYPKHKSANGGKDFWSRGNGWVFAALPIVIEALPARHPDRAHYMAIYQEMAKALAACQQDEGYWTRSLLDPEHAPGRETSGTAFFTFGYLRGLHRGWLDKERFEPVAMKGWKFLAETALQSDGSVGYIQPIGEKAIPGQVVDAKSTADFGVGAYLLAAAEMARGGSAAAEP